MSYNPNISSDYYQSSQDNMEYIQTKPNNQSKKKYSNNIPVSNQDNNYNAPYASNNTQYGQNNTQYGQNNSHYGQNNSQYAQNNTQYMPTNQFSYNPNIPPNNIRYSKGNMTKNNYELFSDNPIEEKKISKFNWLNFGKSVVIYTILFLIMSHMKMNYFVCKFIPLLNNNEVLCMTMKGVIMSIIIIVIQKLIK